MSPFFLVNYTLCFTVQLSDNSGCGRLVKPLKLDKDIVMAIKGAPVLPLITGKIPFGLIYRGNRCLYKLLIPGICDTSNDRIIEWVVEIVGQRFPICQRCTLFTQNTPRRRPRDKIFLRIARRVSV